MTQTNSAPTAQPLRFDWVNVSFLALAHLCGVAAIVYLAAVHCSPWTLAFAAVWGGCCGLSITGGYVYRGKAIPELVGKYVYADYVTGKLWALHYDAAAKKVLTNEGIPTQTLPVITFGEDEAGEIYFGVVSADGKGIFQIVKE